jgi:hypothetical protein
MLRHNLTNGSFPLHRMWWPIVLLLCTKGDSAAQPDQRKLSCFIEYGGRSFYFSARKEMLRHDLTNGSSSLHRIWWPIVLLLARKEILQHDLTNGSFLLLSNVVADRSTSSRKEMLRHDLTNGSFLLHRIWWPIVLLHLERRFCNTT